MSVEHNNQQILMLLALNRLGKPMYHGTANPKKVERRRAKNKVARKSRQMNRKG